jgi:hypothetical protein
LSGDSLVSVLSQLRGGYNQRPSAFSQSVILCGVRDVREYRIKRSDGEIVAGASCFNVKAESLRLGNFSEAEVRLLYGQHTAETGEVFEDSVFEMVMRLTGGQPWLVNALARELTEKMIDFRDCTRGIGVDDVEEAKERLILRRDTHLDQLVDKLQEERVRRVIEPMIIGDVLDAAVTIDDLGYVESLGLIVDERGRLGRGVRIANDIYREVIPRELTMVTECNAAAAVPDSGYRFADGRLDFRQMLLGFQHYYRENIDVLRKSVQYHEALPQLLLYAWLQRVVNGGGSISREYALGRGRADILVRFYYKRGFLRVEQRFLVEIKVVRVHRSVATTIGEGLMQTAGYADVCGPEESHLVVVDPAPVTQRSWGQKVFVVERSYGGWPITVWGM